MAISGARDEITKAVLNWEGATAAPHRFGGTEYRLGRREIGHIHGDHMVDIPFPTQVRHAIMAVGDAEPHNRKTADVKQAIRLLQRSYELAVKQKQRRK